MIWRKFAAAVAGVVVMAGTALAAPPRSLELTAETTVVNGKERMSFTSKTQVKDSKMRVETLGGAKMPDGQPLNSVMLVDPAAKVMYMLNERGKSAMKVKLDQAASQLNLGASGISADPKNVEAEMKKKGGKIVGHESLLGHPTDIWSVPFTGPDKQPTTAKIWLAKDLGMPLKMEVVRKDKTQTMSLRVTNVRTNVTLADSLFLVPKGYKVTDMADLAKRMQQQGKPLPSGK